MWRARLKIHYVPEVQCALNCADFPEMQYIKMQYIKMQYIKMQYIKIPFHLFTRLFLKKKSALFYVPLILHA